MFKKSALPLIAVLAIVLLSVSGCGEQKILTDDDLCKNVFDAIQSQNVDAYVAMLLTDENVKELVDGLDETNPKEKSIKDELATGFKSEEVKAELKAGFTNLIENAKLKSLDLAQATYVGVLSDKTRYEAGNHQCRTLNFGIDFGEEKYYSQVGFFQTETSRFVYDLRSLRPLED